MITPVIMAGGVGSRLWPVSRKLYPKQFVSFQPGELSLFQQSLARVNDMDTVGPAIVVCNEEHRFLVAEQLRELDIRDATIILEPEGRNTAPAVALAALAAGGDDNATLLVLAADHIIDDVPVFHQAITEGAAHADAGKLVTFGIVPGHPETGYGYIRRGRELGSGFAIDSFVEKPDLATAQAYLESGEYFWNSGMFMFTAATYLDALIEYAPDMDRICREAWRQSSIDLDFRRIPQEIFSQCPSNSIDYAVMEHTAAGVVITLDAGWNDLGAWSAFWDEKKGDVSGNVARGDVILRNTRNSFIHAESRLVSLVGMDDAVVVETPDAVLVSTKDCVQDVKFIVEAINAAGRTEADTHVRVYRPWGSYESLASGDLFQVKRIRVKPGAALSLQLHHKRAEHWIVVQGRAQVTIGERELTLDTNESTFIPVETKHRLENAGEGELVLIEVQCGSYLGEDDIERFDDIYGRVQT